MRHHGSTAVFVVVALLALAAVVAPRTTDPPAPAASSRPLPVGGTVAPFGDAAGRGAAAVPARTSPRALRAAVLRLRCVGAEDGAPLPAAFVHVGGELTTADDDGCVALDVTPGRVTLHAGAPRRLGAVRVFDVGAGASIDLGDVALGAGATVRGLLVDADERPCGDVGVRLATTMPPPRDDGWHDHWSGSVRTGADGTFTFATPLPAGPADAVVDGPPLVGSPRVLLTAGGDDTLLLTCRATGANDWIDGVVVHAADGAAVANVLVRTLHVDPGSPAAGVVSARSGPDGRFRLFRDGGRADTAVWLGANDLTTERACAPVGPMSWGTRDVVLQLAAGPSLALRIVDATTGTAIDGVTVQCMRSGGVRAAGATRRVPRPGPGGVVWVDDVPAGPGRLVVWPDDDAWLPSTPVGFTHDHGSAVVTVELARAQPVPVHVRTRSGAPCAGATVELLLPADGAIERDLADVFTHGGSGAPVTLRLAHARTGADGRATLRWFADPRPLRVRVHGGGAGAVVHDGVRLGADGLEIDVPDTGELVLRLRGAGGARVVACDLRGERLPPPWAPPWQLDADGNGRFDVPAGTWDITLLRQLEIDGHAAPVWIPAPAAVGRVEVAAGGAGELAVDLRGPLARGELHGIATVDGAAAERVLLLCGGDGGAGAAGSVARHVVEARPDASGAFRFAGLAAGHYTVQVSLRCGGATVVVAAGGWLELGAGERRALPPITIATAPIDVVVRGAPPHAFVELAAAPATAMIAPVDDDGVARFVRMPSGSYRVRLRTADTAHELGRIECAGGRPAVHTFDVR